MPSASSVLQSFLQTESASKAGKGHRPPFQKFAVVERYGVWAVVAARISPAISTDAVSIAAGLGRMKFLRFIAATAAGTLPLTVAIAWLGADIDRLKTGLVWISVVSVAIFAAYVVYDRRRRSDERA